MQTSTTTSRAQRATNLAGWIITSVWLITILGARAVLDRDLQLPGWIKLTAALVPILPTAAFLRFAITSLRRLDELHRRVHLEALVIAYPLAILLLVTLGLLQLAIDLPVEDWSYRHIWPFLPAFYFLGMAIAWKRYQ
jgi:hypothetical protein